MESSLLVFVAIMLVRMDSHATMIHGTEGRSPFPINCLVFEKPAVSLVIEGRAIIELFIATFFLERQRRSTFQRPFHVSSEVF